MIVSPSISQVISLHHQLLTASAQLRYRSRMQCNAGVRKTAQLHFRIHLAVDEWASLEQAGTVTGSQGSVRPLAGTTPRCRDGLYLLGYGRSPNRRARRQRDTLDTRLLIERDHRASDSLSNRLTCGTRLY
jgi:hypothetical protein